MRVPALGVALLVALTLATGVAAQTPPQAQPQPPVGLPPPLLTIDAERLFDGSALGRAVEAEVEAAAAALAEENRRIEAELLAEERALTDRRPVLPPEEFRALAEAFDAKVERLRAEQDAKERALVDLREEGRQRFLREAIPVLSAILRDRGALALLDRRDVFLSADGIDITDEAIRRMDAAADAPPPP